MILGRWQPNQRLNLGYGYPGAGWLDQVLQIKRFQQRTRHRSVDELNKALLQPHVAVEVVKPVAMQRKPREAAEFKGVLAKVGEEAVGLRAGTPTMPRLNDESYSRQEPVVRLRFTMLRFLCGVGFRSAHGCVRP
jgi:hypothetical protein